VGHTTGWPFGAYDYTGALVPQIGGVPVIVPLAWFAMAVPAREVAARLIGSGWARVALGALALTAWDLMLDPQMVEAGYWVWEADGPWRGIPLSNYAGWLVSSAVVMTVLDRLLPAPGRSRPLLALYTWWGLSEALAFAVFFGDPVVGLVGGAAMLGLAVLAWRGELHVGEGAVTSQTHG
jgi:putative membrane protein